MGIHKLTAGTGYLYLVRQVAAHDRTHTGPDSLGDYYSSKGETPGRWAGRGLAGLAAGMEHRAYTDQGAALWNIEAGSEVTEDQMKNLFGLGVHPNATPLARHLMAQGASRNGALAAVKLGRPFHVNAGETPLQQRLAVAFRDHNLSQGKHWNAPIEEEVRAQMRTRIATEMFEEEHGRPPADERELTGYIARGTRQLTTSVAGYDMTYTPVKSVSALYALAPLHIAEIIEKCHTRAVEDAQNFLQDTACYTRIGAQGVAQVDTDGFIAAHFLHRDTRASDPGLHTHVAVSNKVRAQGTDGIWRWYALDGRPLYASTVAASELYNTRLEAYLGAELGMRFASRGHTPEGKREVREVVGVDPELLELWSSRRAAIDAEYAVLAKKFQAEHGREPTTPESIALFQQANLATRAAKHEPRSLAEQRQEWRAQAIGLLGDERALNAMLGRCLGGRARVAPTITTEWLTTQAQRVITTVSQSRSTWQRTHVLAEALRVIRSTGHAITEGLADQIADLALSEPLSIRHAHTPDTDLGEPTLLRRKDGTSVYRLAGSQTYTSAEILAAEQRIMAAATLTDGRRVDPMEVEMALLSEAAHRRELNAGQAELVRQMASRGQRVMLALAPAGAGKTTAMSALARAWEGSGGTVIGLSPSASAAQILRDEIDIDVADTLDKFNWLSTNPHADAADPARQWFDRIDHNTLLIVDEAGKAGTLALDAVITTALARGASVRLIGDDKQLSSISAGGVLRDLAHDSGAITLSQVMRFASAAEAQAGLALREGDPAGIAFYIDHQRVHVGTDAMAIDMAFDAWRKDNEQGHHSLLLAPTHDLVTELNERARLHRLTKLGEQTPTLEAQLASGSRASVGDIVFTKKNSRALTVGPNDFVRNGYRWEVTAVDPDGSLTVTHLESGAHRHLPGDYVRAHVTLGYAATIDSAQGATARHRCHTVGSDRLSRQQIYTALTRGVKENHIYFSTAENDPHRILTPKATHPDTAVDVLTRALARDAAQVSATSLQRETADPRRRLSAAAHMYTHAVGAAAEQLLTPAEHAALDRQAEEILPGLTTATAWPVLRQHLSLIAANGYNPLKRLAAVVRAGDFDDAADPAAVIDWRLDPSGSHSGGTGPLPWLPAIPSRLRDDPHWGPYLHRRAELIQELDTAVRTEVATWTTATAPRWARPIVGSDAALAADLAVYRAATDVDDADTRIAGTEQYPARLRASQRRLEKRAAAAVGAQIGHHRYDTLVDSINPNIRRDPFWPQLASHLAEASRTGVDVKQLVRTTAAERPLPDELPAAALWWRLCGTLSPAVVETAHNGLRPDWLPDLHTVFGSALAETIAADPAFPALVSAIANADPQRWQPLELLHVAAEHLADADATLRHHLRPDEYARLLTYSIDLFTTDTPYDHDIPTPEHPPLTDEEYEELLHHHPDPQRPHPAVDPLVLTDALADADFLAAALGFHDDLPADPHDDLWLTPPDAAYAAPEDYLDFDSLSTTRPSPAAALAAAQADVQTLRQRYETAVVDYEILAAQVQSTIGGPAVEAAGPRITEMRARAEADRPHLAEIESVIDRWHDDDDTYNRTLALIDTAKQEYDTLRADADSDPLDVASAAQHLTWLKEVALPAQTPAERWFPALQEATRRREAAAGGADNIVTHADVDALLAELRAEDSRLLATRRAELRRLLDHLLTAETAAARAFAEAQMRTAEHIIDQLPRIATELRVLTAAGHNTFQPPLHLDPQALSKLPPIPATALSSVAATPFAITPVTASDRAELIAQMALLDAAATSEDRHIIWSAPTEVLTDPRTAALHTEMVDATTVRLDSDTTTTGTIVVVDHAQRLTPEQIADLADSVVTAQARLVLIDTDTRQWSTAPSAPLLRLLNKDLPWSRTLSADSSVRHHPAPSETPDLQAAITQATGLDPQQHTPEITAVVEEYQRLLQSHRSAHGVHDRLQTMRSDADHDLTRGG
ncbi:MobF family relaxase [Mycolicibacterium goodii]|uniref:MobF family relaxase n=1 Tax=Mycolicibacterium goodii TaxID=134601 RepID=UPI001BDD100E|nr:MobF family relaxase [Mycolicibacterium goodii]MBU8840659.1 relaxase domain-containing protein [Mycolicibacterium goodii]